MSVDYMELDGGLREVVMDICATASSEAAERRIVKAVLAWERARTRAGARWVWWAVAAMVVVVISAWLGVKLGGRPDMAAQKGTIADVRAVPAGRGLTASSNPRGAIPSATQEAFGNVPLRGATARGLGATRTMNFEAAALRARVVVGTGPDQPIKMGEFMPSVGENIHVWTWEGAAPKEPPTSRLLQAQYSGVLSVTPDGRSIVTSDGRVIDVASGESKQLPNFGGRIRKIHFSPDGMAMLVYVGEDNPLTATIRMLEFPSGKKRFESVEEFGATTNATFTADGKAFFAADSGHVVVKRDAATGKQITRYEPGLSNSMQSVAVSADGKYVAACSNYENRLYDGATGKLLFTLRTRQTPATYERGGVSELCFSPDGKYLVACGLSNVFMWDTSTGEVAQVLVNGTGGGSHLRFFEAQTLTIVTGMRATDGRSGNPSVMVPKVISAPMPGAR